MNKAYEIIKHDFDSRMVTTVASYIIEKGWDNVSEITDEQINELEGNGLMTQSFVQALVRTARKITQECELVQDFLPLIQTETNVAGAKMINIYKEDIVDDDRWQQLCDQVDIDYEETEISGMIILED